MNRRKFSISVILFIFTFVLVLTACGNGKPPAVSAIEAYIQALGNQDVNKISTLSCADWEQNALVEVDSFTAVDSKVENLACKEASQEGDNTYVTCTGVIALDYGGESQQIDLSGRTYIARQESGEWRMCGYR